MDTIRRRSQNCEKSGLFQLPPMALTTPNVFSSMSWFSCNTNNIFACCRWRAGDEISEKCVRVKATTACGAAPPEAPCEYGEGDCNGPGDVGRHDGHAGCRGELVCGSNNCRKFGLFYHAKDDCCDLADSPLLAGPEDEEQMGRGRGQLGQLDQLGRLQLQLWPGGEGADQELPAHSRQPWGTLLQPTARRRVVQDSGQTDRGVLGPALLRRTSHQREHQTPLPSPSPHRHCRQHQI